ncbi:MAG TPA: ArsB/NhaD family transporter [Thermoflexia bacterium]|nr:ArsB/NhaD family transporter [Thermoflexia bacterium]
MFLLTVSAILLVGALPQPTWAAEGAALAGRVVDFQQQPVRRARIALYLNGEEEPYVEGESQRDGTFVLDLPDEPVDAVRLEISHPHFRTATWKATWADLERLNDGSAVRLPDIVLERQLTVGFWIATLTFLAVLLFIATERLHSTMAALLGTAVILGISLVGRPINEQLFIIDFEQAIEYVDFNVVFLVMGMMIVIGVIEETGIFQWMAYQAYRLSQGRVWLLVASLMLLTSVASALLDNVTTMLLVAPITLQIALTLGIDPLALLMPEVLASNVGGISTLIGTPTNILIGSYADITFNDFLVNLTPGVLLAQVALTVYVLLVYRKQYRAASAAASPALLAQLEENARITQPDKLRKAGSVFLGIIVLFILGEQFHLVPAVTAILGAVAMLLVVRADIEQMLRVVDWTTLMFFIALFIVVGAVQEVGLISYIAAGIRLLVGDNLIAATLVVVWAGAILSGVIANIPFTAAMLPVVGFLTRSLPGASNKVLFYSLSIGAAMGGNSSLIGASANIVTAGIAERAGYPITYRTFLKIGLPAMAITVTVGTAWLFIHF